MVFSPQEWLVTQSPLCPYPPLTSCLSRPPPGATQGREPSDVTAETRGPEGEPYARHSPWKPGGAPIGGFHPLPPSAVWPRALGTMWADKTSLSPPATACHGEGGGM